MRSTLFNTPINSTLHRLAREMDRVFDTDSGPSPAYQSQSPSVNVWKDDDTFVLEAEIPGFATEDIDILVQGNIVTLKGQRVGNAPESAAYVRRERSISRFEREVRLPVEVDADDVSASLTNGVLRVSLPIAESVKPRRIEIDGCKALPNPSED